MKKIMLLSLILFCPIARGELEIADIRRIASEKPSETGIPAPFKQFPRGEKYSTTVITGGEGESKPTESHAKIVGGKYFVTNTRINVEDLFSIEITMDVEYNELNELYYKTVLISQDNPEKNEELLHLVGNFLPDQRVMNWTSFPDAEGRVITALEIFSDDRSSAREIVLKDGEIASSVTIKSRRTDD